MAALGRPLVRNGSHRSRLASPAAPPPRLPGLLVRAPRRPDPRRRGFRGLGTSRGEALPHAATCQRLRAFADIKKPRARVSWGDPLDSPSRCRSTRPATRSIRHDLRRPDPRPRELPHGGGRRRSAANCYAIQSLAWAATQLGTSVTSRSCSPVRWRHSSRGRARTTRRPSVTPAAASISTRRRPTSRPSIRSCPGAGHACSADATPPARAHSPADHVERDERGETMDDASIHARIEKMSTRMHECENENPRIPRRRTHNI